MEGPVKSKRFYSSKKKSVLETKIIPDYVESMNYTDCDLIQDININQNLIDRIQQQIDLLKICDTMNIDIDNDEKIVDTNISINCNQDSYFPISQDMMITTNMQPKYKIGDKVKLRTYYMSSCSNIPFKQYETKSYHFYTIIDILVMNKEFLYVLMYEDINVSSNSEEKLRDYYMNGLQSKFIYQKFENDLFTL